MSVHCSCIYPPLCVCVCEREMQKTDIREEHLLFKRIKVSGYVQRR